MSPLAAYSAASVSSALLCFHTELSAKLPFVPYPWASSFSFLFICFHLILTYLQEERLKARMAELEAKLQAQARQEIEIIRNPNWYLQEYRPILFPSFIAFDVWSFLYFETEPLEELEHQIDPKCSWASGPGKGSWKRPCRGQNGSKQLLLTVSTRWVFCWKGLTLT